MRSAEVVIVQESTTPELRSVTTTSARGISMCGGIPAIRFVSKHARSVDWNDFDRFVGLSIRGLTSEVVLSSQGVGAATAPTGETRVGKEASAEIGRKEWDIRRERGAPGGLHGVLSLWRSN